MREILFRGKRLDNGEGVEGSLISFDCKSKVIFPSGSKVYGHATIGQYTGLKDKNGKRIFEGDVITRQWLGDDLCYVVGYDREICGFIGNAVQANRFTSFYGDGDCFEIIGNIHDNPELMECDKN